MTAASVTPLYPTLRDRVTKDSSWKMFGACGTRPAHQCTRCLRFDEGLVLCKCKEPRFVVTTEEAWTTFWYPDRGADVQGPKKICNKACNVRKACLEYALANHEVFGVWGGHAERERRRLRMGRPLTVICVYCNGEVKAGQWTRRTCNRQSCKARWADERAGIERASVLSMCEHCAFTVVADEPMRVCNQAKCKDWAAANPVFAETDVFADTENAPDLENSFVVLDQGFFDLADEVVEELPAPMTRSKRNHPASVQLTLDDLV